MNTYKISITGDGGEYESFFIKNGANAEKIESLYDDDKLIFEDLKKLKNSQDITPIVSSLFGADADYSNFSISKVTKKGSTYEQDLSFETIELEDHINDDLCGFSIIVENEADESDEGFLLTASQELSGKFNSYIVEDKDDIDISKVTFLLRSIDDLFIGEEIVIGCLYASSADIKAHFESKLASSSNDAEKKLLASLIKELEKSYSSKEFREEFIPSAYTKLKKVFDIDSKSDDGSFFMEYFAPFVAKELSDSDTELTDEDIDLDEIA